MSSVSVDDDLDKAWADIIQRCNKITKWDLNEKENLTIDQVVSKINPPKDGKSGGHEKAKSVFMNTLTCVQRFGQFAAQAAGMVFGPSQQCFNAINFVISAVQDYDAVFANITALMERVSAFLDKLRIYLDDTEAETKLDKRLRKTVYQVLEQFLLIMGTAHKLTHGWKGKFKLAVKVGAFGDDEGVKDSLARLETLVSDVTRMEITVIVKDLSDAAKNIRGVDKKIDQIAEAQEQAASSLGQLTAAEDKRTALEQEKQDLEKLKQSLNIKDNEKPWEDKQNEYWSNHVQGTGEWLLNYTMPSFSRWADPAANAVHMFTVKAPGGFGKSHLSSRVVKHLLDKHAEDPRAFVAYYFSEKEPGEKSSPLNRAMKSIIWQFASASQKEYAKLAVKACDRKTDFTRTADLWRRLVTDVAKSMQGTFFIILDGVDDLDKETSSPLVDIIQQIQSNEDSDAQLSIRMFLTGIPSVLDAFKEDIDLAYPEIDLTTSPNTDQSFVNEDDLLLYTEDRLNRMDRFQDADNQELVELKGRIKAKLSEGARGDYSALDYRLDDISRSRTVRQVEEILERASESRTQEIAREISQLNDTLSKDEIREVNEILLWYSASFKYFNVKQFEAILSLKAETQSLISLEKQIRDRYSGLFDIDEDKMVTLRTDDITEYLTQSNEQNDAKENGSGRSSNATFEEGEVSLVKRILKIHFNTVFGGEDVYQRFRFDEFFESKLGDQAVRIRLMSMDECHVRAALGCLVILCDKPDDSDYAILMDYVGEWFADHLKNIELEKTDPSIRQEIGRKLVRLLREPSLIDAWWTPDRMFMTRLFIYDDLLHSPLYFWLKDLMVQRGMSDMPAERQWVAEVTVPDTPSIKLFCNIANVMARRWFERREDMWSDAFFWIRGYVPQTREETVDVDALVPVETINDMIEWAKTELGNANEEAQWHATAALTLWNYNWNRQAVERYRQALELIPGDWTLELGLAKSLGDDNDYEEALKTIQGIVEKKHELLDADEKFTKSYWEEMLLYQGQWSLKRKKFTAAETAYQEILDHGLLQETFVEYARKAAFFMTEAWYNLGKFADTISLLLKLSERSDSDTGSWLAALFTDYSSEDTFHARISTAALNSEQIQTVREKYEHAIEMARSRDSGAEAFVMLRCYLGSLLWRHGSDEEGDVALKLWEENVMGIGPGDTTDSDVMWVRSLSARVLGSALLDRARQAGLSTPMNPQAALYAARLQKLADENHDVTRVPTMDMRLTLARLYHLAGDDSCAKDKIRDYLTVAFRMTEEDENRVEGYKRVASALQAIDDDVNAIATWRLIEPDEPEAEETAEDETAEEGTAGEETAEEETKGVQQDGNEEDQAAEETEDELPNGTADQAADETEQQEEKEAEDKADDEAAETNGINGEADATHEADSEDKPTEETSTKDKLIGPLQNHCDGACGTIWNYADDFWACKDCLDVWFDTKCHDQLVKGELDMNICASHHSHIHVPALDIDLWRQKPKDQMYVGDTLFSRDEWVQGIKKAWQIDEESLNAKQKFIRAANKIQKAWRVSKKG